MIAQQEHETILQPNIGTDRSKHRNSCVRLLCHRVFRQPTQFKLMHTVTRPKETDLSKQKRNQIRGQIGLGRSHAHTDRVLCKGNANTQMADSTTNFVGITTTRQRVQSPATYFESSHVARSHTVLWCFILNQWTATFSCFGKLRLLGEKHQERDTS